MNTTASTRLHWPEYLMEAAGLGLFMVSACTFGVLLEHPASPVRSMLPDPFVRRCLMGLAMGLTAVAIIYSPWGKQSGAHLNPAVTLTFLRLGKVAPVDALGYVLAQFAGGVLGVAVMLPLLGKWISAPEVNFVATLPGSQGIAAALLAEVLISFILMTVVLCVSNTPSLARFTGIFAGCCVALFITFEAPFSGMSINPARTVGSAVWANVWTALWIYFIAPPVGMLAASSVHLWLKGRNSVACAKLHHHNSKRCIFCEHQSEVAASPSPGKATASPNVRFLAE